MRSRVPSLRSFVPQEVECQKGSLRPFLLLYLFPSHDWYSRGEFFMNNFSRLNRKTLTGIPLAPVGTSNNKWVKHGKGGWEGEKIFSLKQRSPSVASQCPFAALGHSLSDSVSVPAQVFPSKSKFSRVPSVLRERSP